ncbi:MBL fold metallo-hydrolase [Betaproteobacteria bacterium PRO7]|nr:MBL fold metallo-hydrolase [Betaproteobacteria bacterium PRO7]
MRLTFFGAAGEVTGSCLRVEADDMRLLVDCGMFQGGRDAAAKNRVAYARDLGRLDFVLLTHAHIDHCGLLPRFAARGRAPMIYCTKPTADLVPVMLKDSAYVQARGSNASRGRARGARATAQPLYAIEDIDRLATRLCAVPYDVEFRPHPNVAVRFRSAGHIVGAAFAEIRLRDGGRERTLLVSGDLGEASPLVVRDRDAPGAADVLVVESTYGDRNHRSLADTEDELVGVLHDVLYERRGNVIVPAFALGRTQEFLVLLYRLARAGRLRVPLVFVDSPLAAQASEVTFAHLEALDELAHEFHLAQRARKLPFTLRYTESVDDSMFLNSIRNGAVIVAASGMCEAGRIRHHLRHNLPRRECAVLFTGFQAEGTLGRRIVDGARSVRLFNETIPVHASVHTLGGLSAHAGQDSLMAWLRAVPRRPKAAFVAHGEPEAAHALSARIARELKWNPTVAAPETRYDV